MIQNTRPKLKIPKSALEKILQIVALAGVIFIWINLITSWHKLPDTIPTHFGMLGKPDEWGDKESLLITPIIVTVLYIFLSLIEMVPHYFNYLAKITEENAERQYKNARTLMEWINAEAICFCLYMEWKSVQVALSKSEGLGLWMLLIFVVALFGTMGFYIHRSVRLK